MHADSRQGYYETQEKNEPEGKVGQWDREVIEEGRYTCIFFGKLALIQVDSAFVYSSTSRVDPDFR